MYSDLLTGYVRIGDGVYKAGAEHDYKTLPRNEGRELIKALVSRAARVGRFDLSMMDPSWLKTIPGHQQAVAAHPEHTMKEADETVEAESAITDPKAAIMNAMEMLKEHFGDFTHDPIQIEEMEEMLVDATPPYYVELTPGHDGIQIVGENNIGVGLFNNDGKLYWEF